MMVTEREVRRGRGSEKGMKWGVGGGGRGVEGMKGGGSGGSGGYDDECVCERSVVI